MDNCSDAISNGHLVYGPHLQLLESSLMQLFNKKYVVLTTNGFSAVFLALKAAELFQKSILTASASTCYSVVNAIKAAGYNVVYGDLDMETASLPVQMHGSEALAAIVPDHFGVVSPACKQWNHQNGFLIEDACQSFLSRSQQVTGANVVIISFYPSKLINGIDGGAILTDDIKIFDRAKSLCSYSDQYLYESEPRYNLKMNNINAAVALGSLTHLNAIQMRMLQVYQTFSRILEKRGISFLRNNANDVPSRFLIIADTERLKTAWLQKLARTQIEASCELSFVCPESEKVNYPVAKNIIDRSFSIPFHPMLEDRQISTIERALLTL